MKKQQLTPEEKERIYTFLYNGFHDVLNELYPSLGMAPVITAKCGSEDGEDTIELRGDSFDWGGTHFQNLIGHANQIYSETGDFPKISHGAIAQFLAALMDTKIQDRIFAKMGRDFYESDGHYQRESTPQTWAEKYRRAYNANREQLKRLIDKLID